MFSKVISFVCTTMWAEFKNFSQTIRTNVIDKIDQPFYW